MTNVTNVAKSNNFPDHRKPFFKQTCLPVLNTYSEVERTYLLKAFS